MGETCKQSNHANKILSRMNQFHSDKKYWDVQLRVDTKVFKCHRSFLAANSEYFDTMFSSCNFEESNTTTDQPITLHELDATAFEELLDCLYTGDICVKDSNVLQLLFMNDFLQLCTGLVKERCLEYVKSSSQKNEPMPNALDLLCFAHLKEENVLVDILRAHISRHLYHYYSKDAQLMEISSEILSALLEFSKNYIVPLPGSADILLKIVHKWINHDREGRSQFRSNLMDNINFARTCISYNFARSLMDGWGNLVDKVVNLSKDIESHSELKNLAEVIDTNLTDGSAEFDGTITFVVENVSEVNPNQKVFSSSRTISNLSWKISVQYKQDNSLGTFLYCDGTDLCSIWNCYASAILTIKSQKEGREDFVVEFHRCIFSSDKKTRGWGRTLFSNWNDILDPEKGYVGDDNSLTLVAQVHADVPFLKMT